MVDVAIFLNMYISLYMYTRYNIILYGVHDNMFLCIDNSVNAN